MPSKRKPGWLLHKPTGQARVRIDGKDVYPGPYGSPESRDRYDEIITAVCQDIWDFTARVLVAASSLMPLLSFAEPMQA